jgi:hypothetical protein
VLPAVLIGTFLLFLCGSPALCWSRIGHQAIASIGEAGLNPSARRNVQQLLAGEGQKTLAAVATWADDIRPEAREEAPMHSVRIPIAATSYDRSRDCARPCVVEAINGYLAILSDPNRPAADRLEALKYVVHLVGDVHQPLHASSATGRELVSLGRIVKLHKLWDTTILARAYGSPERLVKRLGASSVPVCGSPAEWATESHAITRSFVYPALGASPEGSVLEITEGYADKALKIMEERVALAGARLACVLNRALARPQ